MIANTWMLLVLILEKKGINDAWLLPVMFLFLLGMISLGHWDIKQKVFERENTLRNEQNKELMEVLKKQ